MLIDDITDQDGDETRCLQRETSEIDSISSLLNESPASTNILVVDTDFVTLLNMKNIMKQYAYEVTIYSDAEEALAFLTNCKHGINIVIWDFHMPGINGIQALKIIGEKMDLPVVIMSDDDQVDSVMEATINGACYYAMKPVGEEILANIWQHIVRKRMMSNPGLIPPVQLDLVHNDDDGLKQDKDDSKIIDRDNSEQSIDKIQEKPQMGPLIGEIESDLVQTDGLDQDNGEQNMDEKKGKKPRLLWTKDLQEKFLKAIEMLGGAKKANPKKLLKCLQDMEIEGLTRSNVSSHLQKHRLSLVGNKIPQQMRENSLSPPCTPMSLLDPNNVHTATSSSLMTDRAVCPLQENQYRNGYLTMDNNQFMTDPLTRLPYFDDHLLQQQHPQQQQHQQQQQQQQQQHQYELSDQLNYMMNNQEPEQASGITDFGLIYPSSPYDPKEFSINGYNFN